MAAIDGTLIDSVARADSGGLKVLSGDRLTIKAAEAVQAAAAEAQRRGNPAIEDLHLLSALLAQDETVVEATDER